MHNIFLILYYIYRYFTLDNILDISNIYILDMHEYIFWTYMNSEVN